MNFIKFVESVDGHDSPKPPYGMTRLINPECVESVVMPYEDEEADGRRYMKIRMKSGEEFGGYQQNNASFCGHLGTLIEP